MAQGRGPGRGFSRAYMTDEEKANQPKVTRALLERIASYFKPYTAKLALLLLTIALASFLSLFPSILTGRIIDEGLVKRDLNALVKYIVLSLAVMLGANLMGVVQSYINTWIAQHITFDMRNQMYAHLQKMSQRFFTTNNQGDIITRMTSDIDGVRQLITTNLTNILSDLITVIISMVAMFRKNWILALIGIVIVPLFTLPTRRAGKTRWKYANESQACNDEINGILNETLSVSGQLLSKLFGREKYEYERYEAANRRMIGLNIKEGMAGRWFRVVLTTFTSIGPMLIYLVGGILMIRHGAALTIGDISVLVALLGRMYMPVNSLLNTHVDWIRSMALFTRIFDYFDIPVEIENAPDAVIPDSAVGNVAFEHVGFGYEKDRPVLRDVSFELKAGHSIAIVGPSGSGKSTIINLIPRLYDVDEGRVTFDGVDVRKLDLGFLRAQVGLVSQETYLFNGTIRENLLYAKPDATEAQMEEALKKANIWEYVSKQPEGLDAVVGNRGLKLSGGEKQRLSIARVLLKNPTIFIFDEATSALDSISEQKIQEAIDPIIQSRTSILIAHRLSTILAADEILVIKDGRIIERGQHRELVNHDGVYRELYETQFSKALLPEQNGVSELEQYIWGQQAGDEPAT
ncbi:MAG: ABC transporter ATP-binding protein [Clostridia bacterium]|nr:ABC transporter ATP-binding protein [Clostridia bacterium]